MTAKDWANIILVLVNLVFGLFCWFIKNEWERIVSDIKDTRMRCDEIEKDQQTQKAVLMTGYVTKADHLISENRIMGAIEKISDKLDRLLINGGDSR